VADDLETFARHAGRNVINERDVELLLKRLVSFHQGLVKISPAYICMPQNHRFGSILFLSCPFVCGHDFNMPCNVSFIPQKAEFLYLVYVLFSIDKIFF
jgi:hypothetical protein